MISVFFRCACPYVGYTLKRADYTNRQMCDCTPMQMTQTGHRLLHSSGSYLVLGRFEGKKYFHIRQTKSTAMDEQGRQIYTNLALVGSTAEDERIINRIAGYALLDEDRFYQEIASMMILLDGDFTVDFDALKAFLDRFAKDYRIETADNGLRKLCKDVFFAQTQNEIDFIVTEADWNYFVKQVGISFRTPLYCFTYHEAKNMAAAARIYFPEIEAIQPTSKEPVQEKTVNRKESSCEEQAQYAELLVLREQVKSLLQSDQRKDQEKQALDAEKSMLRQKLDNAEGKLVACGNELYQLKERIRKSFILGLLVGVIGTVLAVLIFGQITGCTHNENVETAHNTATSVIEVMNAERGDLYA